MSATAEHVSTRPEKGAGPDDASQAEEWSADSQDEVKDCVKLQNQCPVCRIMHIELISLSTLIVHWNVRNGIRVITICLHCRKITFHIWLKIHSDDPHAKVHSAEDESQCAGANSAKAGEQAHALDRVIGLIHKGLLEFRYLKGCHIIANGLQ